MTRRHLCGEMLKGIALANPGTLKLVPEINLIMRIRCSARRQGVDHPGLRVRAMSPLMSCWSARACSMQPAQATFSRPRRPMPSSDDPDAELRDGCALSVNNYTGDGMGFEMAQRDGGSGGDPGGHVMVDDDVAVKDSTYTIGRRGVAGNFFVIKAVGAAAEAGANLDELVWLGQRVNSVTRTMGMALTSCTPPAKGSPLFELGDDEMELGVGIHGEPAGDGRNWQRG